MPRKQSCFALIIEEHFLEETELLEAPEKNSVFERIPQGLSLFSGKVRQHDPYDWCRAFPKWARPQLLLPTKIVVRHDSYSFSHHFGISAEIEAANSELCLFVREQQEVEKISHKPIAPVSYVFSFCCNQPLMRSQWPFFKVFVSTEITYEWLLFQAFTFLLLRTFQYTLLVLRASIKLIIKHTERSNQIASGGCGWMRVLKSLFVVLRSYKTVSFRSQGLPYWALSLLLPGWSATALSLTHESSLSYTLVPSPQLSRPAVTRCCSAESHQEKDTHERWFGVDSVAFSVVDDTAPRTAVGLSDLVEVGDVRCLNDRYDPGLPSCSWTTSNPVKGKTMRDCASPVLAKKRFAG